MEVLRRRAITPLVSTQVVRRVPDRQAAKVELPLPPAVPENLGELEEAMTLLGAYVQTGGKMRQSRLERLQALLGALPSLTDAKAWKSGLKELRGELVELERS